MVGISRKKAGVTGMGDSDMLGTNVSLEIIGPHNPQPEIDLV